MKAGHGEEPQIGIALKTNSNQLTRWSPSRKVSCIFTHSWTDCVQARVLHNDGDAGVEVLFGLSSWPAVRPQMRNPIEAARRAELGRRQGTLAGQPPGASEAGPGPGCLSSSSSVCADEKAVGAPGRQLFLPPLVFSPKKPHSPR